jgi:hypothetical protein
VASIHLKDVSIDGKIPYNNKSNQPEILPNADIYSSVTCAITMQCLFFLIRVFINEGGFIFVTQHDHR